jgi:hypothetical protein
MEARDYSAFYVFDCTARGILFFLTTHGLEAGCNAVSMLGQWILLQLWLTCSSGCSCGAFINVLLELHHPDRGGMLCTFRHKGVHPDRGDTLTRLPTQGYGYVDFLQCIAFINVFLELHHPDRGGTLTYLPTKGCSPRSWRHANVPSDTRAWLFGLLQRRLSQLLCGTTPPRSWRYADVPSDTRVSAQIVDAR